MAINTTEAQLIIRARQIGAQTIDATTASLAKLNAQLAAQVQAAARGEASSKALADTYDKLVTLGETIIKSQVAQVQRYNDLVAVQDKAASKAAELRAKYEAMASAQAASDTVTKRQATSLNTLLGRVTAADNAVVKASGNLAKQAEIISRVGGDVNDLAAFEDRVAESVRNVGTAIQSAGELLDGYDEHLKRVQEDEQFLKDDQAFLDRVAAVKRLQQASAFFAEYEADLQRVAAAEKEAAAVNAFNKTAEENAKIRQQAEYVRDLTAAFNAQEAAQKRLVALQQYNATGTQALASASQAQAGLPSINTAPTASSGLAAQIQGILDPSAAARTTLAGLEAEVARVTAVVGEGEKPIRDYQDAINDLSRIGAATTAQAKLIDSYRAQQAVVTDLTATNNQNLAAVERRAAAMASATEIDDAQVEALTREQSELHASSSALANQIERLDAMGSAMAAAGIDINNLVSAENRLKATSEGTNAVIQKLSKVSGRGGGATGAIFGLKPYDLQNLGYQLNDVFTQLSSGTSVMQTLAQQGGQIAQIPGVLRGLVAFLPELALIAIAVGSVYVAMKRVYDLTQNAREFNAALAGTTDALNYNTASLVKNVKALQDLGISNSDAVAALKIFIKDGVDSTKLDQFTASALALSRVMGTDLATAAKTVGETFTGSLDDILKLNQSYTFLTQAQVKQAIADNQANKMAKVRTDTLNAFTQVADKQAGLARGPWSQAWTDLGVAFNAYADFLGKLYHFQAIGDGLAYIAKEAKEAAQWLARVSGSAPATGAPPVPQATPGAPAALGAGTGADNTQANAAQQARDAADLTTFRRKIVAQEQLNDQQRILAAGQEAYDAAENKHLSEVAAQTEKILAMEAERHKIAIERTQEEQQLASSLKSSVIAAGASNPDDLGAQLAANAFTRQEQQKQIDDARTNGLEGLPQMGGMTFAQISAVFDKQKALADLQTTQNFYLTQQNELMKEYDDLVNKAQSDYANHSTDAAGAAKAIQDAQAKILPGIQKNAAAALAFSKNLEPTPKTLAFQAQFQGSGANLLAKGNADALKQLDDALAKAQEAQTQGLSAIQQQFNEGTISGSDAIQKAADEQGKLTPEIISAAKAAQDFAKALNSASPSPQLTAQIAKYQSVIDNANNNNPKTSVVGKFDIATVNADEQKLNQTIQDRNTLVETYNQLVEVGAITSVDAEAKTKALYEETAPVIQTQIAEIQKMIDTLRGKDGADLPMLDALTAKLQLAGTQAQYVNKDIVELGKTINESIANEAVTAFDSAGQAIGNAIAGTESWGDAFSDIGRASAQFFAGLLKDIAEAILKMEILNALGISGGGSGAGGFGGAIAGALLGGGGAEAAGTAGFEGAITPTLDAAGNIGTAAASSGSTFGSILSWIGALFHTGTSNSAQMSRSNLSPALWANAPRYHAGKPMAGLSADETAAIIQNTEEVLTDDNPRHIKNIGKGKRGGGAGGAQTPLKQVLVLNPDDINSVSAGSGGEQVVLTHIKANVPTIRQLLRIKN